MNRRSKWIMGILIGLVLLFIPFPTSIYSDWTVRFVDESGGPVSRVQTQISCHHYSYTDEGQCLDEEPRLSDEHGYVRYRGESIVRPLIVRIVIVPLKYLLLLAHGSVGPDTYLIVIAPKGYESVSGLISYTGESQTVVVLKQSKDE